MQVCSCVWTENKGIHHAIMFCKYGWCNQDAGKQYEYKHIRCTMLQKKTTLSWRLNHCYLQCFVITRPFSSPSGRGLLPSPLPNTQTHMNILVWDLVKVPYQTFISICWNTRKTIKCMTVVFCRTWLNSWITSDGVKSNGNHKKIANQLCIGLTWT